MMSFKPAFCQHCGRWIKKQESRGRPRQYCDKRCFHARKAADALGLIVLKASDLVPILSNFETIGKIFQRSGHPGCAEWMLRLAESVHRDTGAYFQFGEYLRWLEDQGRSVNLSNPSTFIHKGQTWTRFEEFLATLVMRST